MIDAGGRNSELRALLQAIAAGDASTAQSYRRVPVFGGIASRSDKDRFGLTAGMRGDLRLGLLLP
ncbi:MAG: hypothetical protein WAO08_28410 [Hyphomicrobiaceae bacterium]